MQPIIPQPARSSANCAKLKVLLQISTEENQKEISESKFRFGNVLVLLVFDPLHLGAAAWEDGIRNFSFLRGMMTISRQNITFTF